MSKIKLFDLQRVIQEESQKVLREGEDDGDKPVFAGPEVIVTPSVKAARKKEAAEQKEIFKEVDENWKKVLAMLPDEVDKDVFFREVQKAVIEKGKKRATNYNDSYRGWSWFDTPPPGEYFEKMRKMIIPGWTRRAVDGGWAPKDMVRRTFENWWVNVVGSDIFGVLNYSPDIYDYAEKWPLAKEAEKEAGKEAEKEAEEAELDKETSLFDKNPDFMKDWFKEGKIRKSLLMKIITEEFEKILGEAGRSWDPGNWREYGPKQEPAEETPDPRLDKANKANKLWDEITNREALDNAGLNFRKVGYGNIAMEIQAALKKLRNMKRNIMHDLLLKYLVGHEEQKEQKQLEAWDPATEPPPSFRVFDWPTKKHPRGKIGLANWYEDWVIPAFFGPDGLFHKDTSGLLYYLQLWGHEAYHFTDRRNMGHPRLSPPQRTEPAQGPEEGYAEMPSLADLAGDVATEILKDIGNNSNADISRHYGDITYPSGKKEIDSAVNRIRNQKSKFSNLEELSKAWQEDLAEFILNVLNSEKPQKEKEEPSDYELPPEIDREEFETVTLGDDPDFLDRMASLARNENKMKLTRKQLVRIIKEEVQSVLDEGGRKKKKRKEYTGPTVPELVLSMSGEEGYKSHTKFDKFGTPVSAELGVEDILGHFYYPLSKESKRLIDEVVHKLMSQEETGDINNRAYAALKEVGVGINSFEFPDLLFPISIIVEFLEKVLGR